VAAASADQCQANEKTARSLFEGILDSDYDLMRACLSDDAICWAPPSSARVGVQRKQSADEFVNGSKGMSEIFRRDQMQWVHHRISAEGDHVWVFTTMSTVTNNGVQYDNDYFWLFRFADGKIAEMWESTDTAHAFDILGA
jgi:ketosteroid isomerase-like protein